MRKCNSNEIRKLKKDLNDIDQWRACIRAPVGRWIQERAGAPADFDILSIPSPMVVAATNLG
jgi:hypothetical protein